MFFSPTIRLEAFAGDRMNDAASKLPVPITDDISFFNEMWIVFSTIFVCMFAMLWFIVGFNFFYNRFFKKYFRYHFHIDSNTLREGNIKIREIYKILNGPVFCFFNSNTSEFILVMAKESDAMAFKLMWT